MTADRTGGASIILPSNERPAAYREYDPRAPQVAAHVASAINKQLPGVIVEHIGSTAVPGCGGKGVIDLMLLYHQGQLEEAKAALAVLGFQPQSTRDPFPETRPMRVGAIEFDGSIFGLHIHVIHIDSEEVKQLRSFRERLRADPQLLAGYLARKRQILAAGINDPIDYSIEKGSFIQAELHSKRLEI